MRTAMALLVATTLGGLGVAPACSASDAPQLRADDPAVGATAAESASVYLTLDNTGGDDALVGASCGCAQETTLHVTEDLGGGASMMTAASEIEVPSDGTAELRPGGSHIMLEGLHGPLEEGSSVEVRLEFDRSDPITLEVPVVALATLAERVPGPEAG